jgi:folate-binding protein YgfZ
VFDRLDSARLRLTGADRTAWLQALVTNEVAALGPGQGCYAAYLTPQGRMIADLRVLSGPDDLLLDVPAVAAARLRDRFDLLVITEDVVVEDVTPAVARLSIHGPAAAGTLAAIFAPVVIETPDSGPEPASGLRSVLDRLAEHEWVGLKVAASVEGSASVDPIDVRVAGGRELGAPGFDVYLPAIRAEWLRALLREHDAVDGDQASWHVLRVEAGTPVFGIDMDETTIPLEAGLESRAISFTKGCYVGQEVIVRVTHRGHGRVARRLVGLIARDAPSDAGAQLGHGDPITSVGDGESGRQIGHLTSVAFSPALNACIALGYVHRDFVQPATTVLARHESVAVPFVVTDLPFAL